MVAPLLFSRIEMKRKRSTENEGEKEEEKILIPWSKNRKAEIEEKLRGRSYSGCSSPPKWNFDALTRIFSLEKAKNQSLETHLEEKPCIPCGTRPRLPLPDWGSWVEAYKELGGDGDLVFVFAKRLYKTDIESHQNRLYLKQSKMKEVVVPVMTKEEEDQMLMMSNVQGLKVVTIDHKGRRYYQNFAHWPSVNQYVFKTGWKDLVMDNGLNVGSKVRVWFFRYGKNKELGFIVDCSHPY